MTFDEALRTELITIEELNKKVFPVVAPQEVKSTYLIYKRGFTDFEKTLDGISKNSVDSLYNLVLVADTYSELQNTSSKLVDKLTTFLGRSIGDSGPKIKNMGLKILEDSYVVEIDKYRCDLQITVSY